MKALLFDDGLRVVHDHPMPPIKPGWARIRITMAGICKTDLEIVKGYMGFRGVLGHEFVGTVTECQGSCADAHEGIDLTGRRVVGEINAGCGQCDRCRDGMERHCGNRQVLGILNLNGCMAEYVTLPRVNLHAVPENIPDQRAVFTEPLAAACEILDQMALTGTEAAIVLGDGRLGILCAWILATRLQEVTLLGRHPVKLEMARWRHLKTALSHEARVAPADIVVEATGSPQGLAQAVALCRPRGTVVLKTTVAVPAPVDLTPVVINEICLLGSRCGRMEAGLRQMANFPDMPLEQLITARYPLSDAVEAFDKATRSTHIKVLLTMDRDS